MSNSYKLPNIPQPNGLPESKLKLEELLRINHQKHHILYNGFRANHLPHALCSLYALGATPTQIQKLNDHISERLESVPFVKFTIDENNWQSYISDRSTYSEYLTFFDRELENKEILEVFKEYIPRLIPGLIGSALHPLIHIGYALEFQSKLILSEGLAYACLAYNKLGELVDNLDNYQMTSAQTSSELLKTIDDLNVPNLLLEEGNFFVHVSKAVRLFGPQIKQLLNQWNFNPKDSEILYNKTIDLTLTSVMGFNGSYIEISPDFFYAHGLTGNHAIRTLLPHLKPIDQRRLLQIGFLSMIAMYFARGRVEFDENFVYKPRSGALDTSKVLDWKALIQLTNNSTDDHLIKVVRSLQLIEDTIVKQPNSKFPINLTIEGSRLVVGTIHTDDDWFTTIN